MTHVIILVAFILLFIAVILLDPGPFDDGW